jgi:cytochrome bd ubiquinol oxidase subunit II
MAELVAAVAGLAVIAYAVLGGADFGGGIWDLFASGPRRSAQRQAIAAAMGPVWEANHVWLIFVIVILFTAFPPAYAVLSVALYVPFHLVLLGIVLRGAAFVFRSYARRAGASSTAGEHAWGVVFGAASVVTPLLLGASLGAVSTGRVRITGSAVSAAGAWTAPLALTMGVLALSLCAYLAAVYLVNETDGELREDFRSRALWSGTATVGISALAIPLLRLEAPHLWEGLFSARALPVLVTGIVAALAAGWFLQTRKYKQARVAAVAQIAALLAGWMLAQYPFIVYPDVTLENAAAPPATLQFFLTAIPFGFAMLLPSLWLLFRVFKGAGERQPPQPHE